MSKLRRIGKSGLEYVQYCVRITRPGNLETCIGAEENDQLEPAALAILGRPINAVFRRLISSFLKQGIIDRRAAEAERCVRWWNVTRIPVPVIYMNNLQMCRIKRSWVEYIRGTHRGLIPIGMGGSLSITTQRSHLTSGSLPTVGSHL